jgi:chemotaxis response regulator CheB
MGADTDWLAPCVRRRDLTILNQICLELNGFEHKSEAAQRAMAANVSARLRALGKSSLAEYLAVVQQSRSELDVLVSLLTIHTTSWFRERPHFGLFTRYVKEWNESNTGNVVFRMLSAGCSTGEEPYSFALALESVKACCTNLQYKVSGVDVDPVSVATARHGAYHGRGLNDVEGVYHKYLEPSTTPAHFQPNRSIRQSCEFLVSSLVEPLPFSDNTFDAIVCRNVLIYLDERKRTAAVSELVRTLKSGGLLTLGMSDALPHGVRGLRSLGTTSYIKSRVIFAGELRSSALQDQERLMSIPPQAHTESEAPVQKFDALLIGASTGGIEALQRLLVDLPTGFPPVLVVQHIDANYVDELAELLVKASGLTAAKVVTGAELEKGHIYVAPANRHMEIREHGGRLTVHLSDRPPIGSHRPSATALFESARAVAGRVVACLLTGMGTDGAEALARLRADGAYTLAQDASSSVVFGMPKRAIELGGASFIGNPWQMRMRLLHLLRTQPGNGRPDQPRLSGPSPGGVVLK